MTTPQTALELTLWIKDCAYSKTESGPVFEVGMVQYAIEAHTAEKLRAELQAQHQATWAMAITAVDKIIIANLGITSRALPIIRALPCPPLETKGE